MPYELKFRVDVQGQSALDQIPRVMAQLSQNTKAAASDLQLFERLLRAEIAAGASLSDALGAIASTSKGVASELSGVAKQALSLANAQGAASQAAGNLASANEKTAASADKAESSVRKLTQAQRDQINASRAVRDYAAQPFGAAGPNQQRDGRIQEIAYAENARRTQQAGRLQEVAAAENARRSAQEQSGEQRSGQLIARATAENAKRDAAAIREAEQEANKSASAFLRLGTATGLVDGQFGQMVRGAGGLAGGLGALITPATLATAAIGGIGVIAAKTGFDLVREFGEAEREISNLADRLGITVQEAEKLSSMARLTGVNIGALEASARLLGEALENPTTTGKKAAEALHKMGIETVGLQGDIKEIGPVVIELLDKLSKIPDQATRFALAQETLGRGSKVLQPLIADYAALQRTVASLHVGEDAAGSKELLDADRQIKILDESWMLFKKHLAAAVAPIVIKAVIDLTPGGHQKDYYLDPYSGIRAQNELAALVKKSTDANIDVMRQQGEAAMGTDGADFRRSQDHTKAGLEAQLKAIKEAQQKLVTPLSSDFIDKATRAKDQTEFDRLTAEQSRIEAALKALAEGKKEANRADEEAIRLRTEYDRILRGELTGLDAINAKHDSLIAKLLEEDELNRKEHPGAKPNAQLTPANRAQIEKNTALEIQKFNQHESILDTQSQRAQDISGFSEIRRLEKARADANAAVELAQGKTAGNDEASIDAAFQTRMAEVRGQLELAARQLDDLVKKRDESQQEKKDPDKLRLDNQAINDLARKSAVDFRIGAIDAVTKKELELDALKKKLFQDDEERARNIKVVTDATVKANVDDRRAELQRKSALISAREDSGPGNELNVMRQQLDLRRQIADLDRKTRQDEIDAQRAEQQRILDNNPGDDAAQQGVQKELARLRAEEINNQRGYERELGDERIEIELRIAQIRKQSEDEYKQFVVGLVNSALTGHRAVNDYLREFGKKIFDQVTSNVAGLTFETLRKVVPVVPGQTDADGKPTVLGKILQNVPILGDQSGAAKKAAADVAEKQRQAAAVTERQNAADQARTNDVTQHIDRTTAAVDRVVNAIGELHGALDGNAGRVIPVSTDDPGQPGAGIMPLHAAILAQATDGNTESTDALKGSLDNAARAKLLQDLTQQTPDSPFSYFAPTATTEKPAQTAQTIARPISELTQTVERVLKPKEQQSYRNILPPGVISNPAGGQNQTARQSDTRMADLLRSLELNTSSTDLNTAALKENTAALSYLRLQALSTSGGGGGTVKGAEGAFKSLLTFGSDASTPTGGPGSISSSGPSSVLGTIQTALGAAKTLSTALSKLGGAPVPAPSSSGIGSIIGSALPSDRPSILLDSPNYNPMPVEDIGDGLPMSSGSWGETGTPMSSVNAPQPSLLQKITSLLSSGGSNSNPYGGLSGFSAGLSHTGDLQGILTGVGTGPGGVGAQSLSGAERLGAGIGTAGVVAGGILGAYSGFSQGGARGDLQGVGSILGTAAVLDPEPISKTVLGIGAAVTGVISALLPDPRQERETQIKHELMQDEYLPPMSLDITQSTRGNYVDQNQFGIQRELPFRAAPQVVEPYLYWHNNQAFPVPGNVTAPFLTPGATQAPPAVPAPVPTVPSGPTVNNYIGGHYIAGGVQAIDPSSFADIAMDNKESLGKALTSHLKTGDTQMAHQIRYLTTG